MQLRPCHVHLPGRGRLPAALGALLIALAVVAIVRAAVDASAAAALERKPKASFTVDPPSPAVGTLVTFTATSSAPGGKPLTYGWDLDGDGEYDDGSTATVSRVYETPGTRRVSLRVTDAVGRSATASSGLTVTGPAESPTFGWTPASPLTFERVLFAARLAGDAGAAPATSWDFDDDGTCDDATGAQAEWAYSSPGRHRVTMCVTAPAGDVVRVTRALGVVNRPPAASFSVSPSPGVTQRPSRLVSTSSDPDGAPDLLAYRWDLDGDGQFDDAGGSSIAYSWPKGAVTRVIALRVRDPHGGQSVARRRVVVANPSPTAAFTASDRSPRRGQEVLFRAQAGDRNGAVAAIVWDLDQDGVLGDDPGETGAEVRRSFSRPGNYTVRVQAIDDEGARSSVAVQTISVGNEPPRAAIRLTPASPLTGEQVAMRAVDEDIDGRIVARAWDLDDDGSFDDGRQVTAGRAFSREGTYVVRLRVADDTGAVTTTEARVKVRNRAPSASFFAQPAQPKRGQVVILRSKAGDAEGPVVLQRWDLDGDGKFDDAAGGAVPVVFAKEGDHQVGLQVTDASGAKGTAFSTITVSAPPLPRALKPFPVIRIAGDVMRSGVRMRIFTVTTPQGVRIAVRCRGRRCPVRSMARKARRRVVHLRRLERRLRAGTLIEVWVTKPGRIGKYTRIRIRAARAPARINRCVPPGSRRSVACASLRVRVPASKGRR